MLVISLAVCADHKKEAQKAAPRGRCGRNEDMDLKDIKNKETLQQKIKDLTDSYYNDLIALTENDETYKKAALLFYWLRDYKNSLKREKNFDAAYLPNFYKGNIVSVNLGFNLGSELGGKHYAIVLRDSSTANPALNILPLSSIKPSKPVEKLKSNEIFLGNEIYRLLSAKCSSLLEVTRNEEATLQAILDTLDKDGKDNATAEIAIRKMAKLYVNNEQIKKTKAELAHLKKGSYARLDQIRIISKMRLYQPTDSYSALHGIRISADAMRKIEKALIDFYGITVD